MKRLLKLFLFLFACHTNASSPYLYVGGDLGINYLLVKSHEGLAWSGSNGDSRESHTDRGLAGDIVVGVLKPFQRFLVGLNGNIMFLNDETNAGVNGNYSGRPYFEINKIKLRQFYEIAFQSGILLGDHTQVYVAIAPAYGQFDFFQSYLFTTDGQATNLNNAVSLWGLDVGVGMKVQIIKHIAINLSVQNVNFSSKSLGEAHGQDTIQYSPSVLIGKIGAEYRF